MKNPGNGPPGHVPVEPTKRTNGRLQHPVTWIPGGEIRKGRTSPVHRKVLRERHSTFPPPLPHPMETSGTEEEMSGS